MDALRPRRPLGWRPWATSRPRSSAPVGSGRDSRRLKSHVGTSVGSLTRAHSRLPAKGLCSCGTWSRA
eukprot:9050632-Alexandrium_andersonii.AAC.1